MSPHRTARSSLALLASVLAVLASGGTSAAVDAGQVAGPVTAPAAAPVSAPIAPSVAAPAAPATVDVAPVSPVSSLATTTTTTTTQTLNYPETSSRITYRGTWALAWSSGYAGGRIKWSRQRGASATFTFTGIAVSWIGPVGPTRGQANVYLNGHFVRTVNLHATSFVARRTVFSARWATQATRTLRIVVLGTAGHPKVGIDTLSVRRLVTATAPATAPATSGTTVRVASIAALLAALRDNAVGEVVVANGTYHVSPSNQAGADSLWIGGGAITARTRAVTVRAETLGGVTFDGTGGSGDYGGLSFEDGAHDQTWDGLVFAHMTANYSGIIEIAGYTTRAAPHHITLRHMTILATCTGRATTAHGNVFDHGVYISQSAYPGPHDLVFEDMTVRGEGNLATAFHFFHGADRGAYNAHDVLIRRLTVTHTQQAVLIWEPTVRNVTLDTAWISDARAYAIRYETMGSTYPSGIVIENVTSTGSGYQGFYSTLGTHPPGVTFANNSLH